MKTWSTVTNKTLHALTLSAAQNEKSATITLLEHLAEIDRRRLYAEMGFPSLWVYVHELLGYSESQTSDRVNAMRLMMKIPEVKNELESGKISLTTTAKLATHVRREKTSTSETLNLLSAISGKSSREVEQYLAQNSVVDFKMDKLKSITPQTTRIIIDVDLEFLELINRVRELKGHPGTSTQELLKVSMQNLVKKHEIKPSKVSSKNHQQKEYNEIELPAPEVKTHIAEDDSRYIPTHIRTKIRLRSGDQCEFVDHSTQRRCNCKTKLEFDHIIPYSLGGQTTFENLRHFCSSHNKLSAIRQFGRSHMSLYLNN